MDQRDRVGFTSLSRPYLLECFWSCCHRSGWTDRDCNFIYQLLWGYMLSHQDLCNNLFEITVAKRTYLKKLEDQFTSNDSASVWKGLKAITKYRTLRWITSTEVNQQLAEDLNEFYCRFETPHTPSDHLSTQPLTPSATPLSTPPAFQISEDDERQVFRKNKRRKAPGPDGVTPA